ncbi:hypothetical protein ABGB17_10850 [Sphaerisporangium sp. B11E5]
MTTAMAEQVIRIHHDRHPWLVVDMRNRSPGIRIPRLIDRQAP